MIAAFRHGPRAAMLLLVAATACRSDSALTPPSVAPPTYVAAAIRCSVTVADERVTCGAGSTVSGGDARSLVDEAQRRPVEMPGHPGTIAPMAVQQVTGGGVGIRFEAEATVRRGTRLDLSLRLRNLLPVALGVQADGATALDTTDVYAVLPTPPVLTEGTGSVSLEDARFGSVGGIPNVSFHTYDGPVMPNSVSRPRLWSFNADPTVTAFTFDLVVLAQVREDPLAVRGAGGVSSLALLANGLTACAVRGVAGTLYCWGEDALVTSGTTFAPDPFARRFDALRFERMAGYGDTRCGLTQTGNVWCWGGFLQLPGAGGAFAPWRPTSVLGGQRYTAITVGGQHVCGLAADSTAWCAGDNDRGQLGNGRPEDFALPTAPTRVAGPWKFTALDAGDQHTCGVHADGTALCWGDNGWGQLGDSTFVERPVPTPVQGATRFRRVSAGVSHTCAVSTTGEAWCWGSNGFYQLGRGDDDTSPAPTPQLVANAAFGGAVDLVSAGGDHSCAITTAQSLFCWGDNSFGQLGQDPQLRLVALGPEQVPGVSGVRFVEAVPGSFTCAIVIGSVVSCWGVNFDGQLGAGFVTTSGAVFDAANTIVLQPSGNGVTVPPTFPESPFAIGSSGGCTTATNADNGAPRSVLCWGGGGTLGRAARGIDPGGLTGSAPRGIATRVRFASVAVGNEHACALTPAGEAWCWGQNARGELGDGTTTERPTPVRVTTPVRFAQLALGQDHSCGLSQSGEVWCWGSNSFAQFGDNGSVFQSAVPVQVPTGGATFTQLASGSAHLCALDAAGTLFCWGSNDAGQALAASGSLVGTVTPFAGAQRFSAIAAGDRTGCGIEAATGRTWCWGSNDVAQLGRTATFTANPSPEVVADAPAATTVSTGGTTCIGTAGGSVWCWGANFGQQVVAAASEGTVPQPTRIDAPVPLFAPRASFVAACALDAGGEPWCWGNSFQAGFGGQAGPSVPRRLVLP